MKGVDAEKPNGNKPWGVQREGLAAATHHEKEYFHGPRSLK